MLLLNVICLPIGELVMKRTWNTPELTVYGPVQEITQKVIGFGDAIIFDSREGGGGDDNDGPAGGSL
jgi:hypothetical protein